MQEHDETTPAPEPPQLCGVIVIRETGEDGSIRAVPMIQGDIDPLAVQTLLELGAAAWRERIGLPPR